MTQFRQFSELPTSSCLSRFATHRTHIKVQTLTYAPLQVIAETSFCLHRGPNFSQDCGSNRPWRTKNVSIEIRAVRVNRSIDRSIRSTTSIWQISMVTFSITLECDRCVRLLWKFQPLTLFSMCHSLKSELIKSRGAFVAGGGLEEDLMSLESYFGNIASAEYVFLIVSSIFPVWVSRVTSASE